MKQSAENKKMKSRLNTALILIGLSAVVIAVVLFLTIPEDAKAQFLEYHSHFAKGPDGEIAPPFFHGRVHHRHGGILFIVLIALIAAGIMHRKAAFHKFHRQWNGGSAMDILRKEYATGDISKEEYLARKSVLENGEGGEE